MSRIDDLIGRLCPEGVPFKALGDVAELLRGNGMPKIDLTDNGVGAIHYGQIYTYYGVWTTSTIAFVTPTNAAKLANVDPGDIVITNTSENIEDVGKAVAWLGEKSIVTGGHATVIKHHEDPKYLAYWFQSESFSTQKRRLVAGTKVIELSVKNLAKIRVPIPPVEVQREIVGVLDRFAGLEAELEAELVVEGKARGAQYAHYRDRLFSFGGPREVRRAQMGDVGDFIRGRRFTKNDVADGGIPSIHYGEIYTHYGIATTKVASRVREDLAPQLRYAKPGDVVIAAVGETVEDVGKAVAWLGTTDVAIHDDCFLYRSHVLDPKFVSYYLRTEALNRDKAKYVARAKVKRLSGGSLAKLVIPVPTMDEQRHVVAVLDKLDALVNDFSVSLPAELLARRKQYEHYRDRLLTFKELSA